MDDTHQTSSFLPHGYCFEWRSDILWLNVISDVLIATAYFSIPLLLALFLKKRTDLQFRGIFILFAAFIFLCGVTHLFSIYVIWKPEYGIHGILKAATALVSIMTAIVLYRNFDKAIQIPTREEHDAAIRESEAQRFRSEQLELERRNEAIFKFTTELVPTGLLVIDKSQHIVLSNAALDALFGYDSGELEGLPLDTLLEHGHAPHRTLVSQYMQNPTQSHRMAAGRRVQGKHKSGKLIDIQISLSVHKYGDEQYAFAVITDSLALFNEAQQYSNLSGRIMRAIDASNEGIWEWNVQTNDVWYSPSLLEMIGQKKDAAADFMMWKNHIHPEDWPMVETNLNQHLTTKAEYDVSYRGLNENGVYQWFHTRGNTIFADDDTPLLMSGTLRNIHHVKELEDKLRRKTNFLNEVLERSLTGIYIFDLEQQKNIYINAEYTHLTGYTLDELNQVQNQSDLMPLFHPDDFEAINKHFQSVIEDSKNDKTGIGIEYRFRHADGTWRWFYSRDSIYTLNEDGSPKEMLGAFFDISALKERETEIKKLARDYATTFEQAGLGIAHVSIDGKFLKTNKKLHEILGFSAEELKGKSFSDVTHPDDIAIGFEAIKEFKAGKRSFLDLEKRYIRKDGEVFWAHLTTTIVESIGDEPPYYISIIEDISARKEMENNLSDSNAALERFAYSASHDLQEPLRKINAFSDLLEARLKNQLNDPEARFQLNRITESASRMSEMIDNLLELSRASKTQLYKEEIRLSEIIELAKIDLSHELTKQHIDITLLNDTPLFADKLACTQIIRNLISNSLKYVSSERQQRIEISSTTFNKRTQVIYRDYGTGIVEEELELMFEPFRRAVGREIPGTGMGLAICKQLVKAQGGKIWAESPERHDGILFYLDFPNQESS